MNKENNFNYTVLFTEEFNLCLDKIQEFFLEQGDETLKWWYSKEDEIINYIESHLSELTNMGADRRLLHIVDNLTGSNQV